MTKAFTGGAVYLAPRHLDPGRVNALVRVARVPDFATDAALLPDGHHVIVRSYFSAAVYTFPGFRRIGGFGLPAQRQGEGISVGSGGRILLSSEGVHQPVLRIELPTALAEAVTGRAEPSASPPPASPRRPPRHRPRRASAPRRGTLWRCRRVGPPVAGRGSRWPASSSRARSAWGLPCGGGKDEGRGRPGRHHRAGGRRGRQRGQPRDARRRRRRRRHPPGRRAGRAGGLPEAFPARTGHRRGRLDDGRRPRGHVGDPRRRPQLHGR